MKAIFTQSFKIKAVEKALSRSDVTSLKEVSDTLGVGYSTLHKWIVNLRNQDFKSVSTEGMLSVGSKRKETSGLEPRRKIGDYHPLRRAQ
jgi:transposase